MDIIGHNLFEEKLDDLPSISTSANISDEFHFISKIHATKKIPQSQSVTHHINGTSWQNKTKVSRSVGDIEWKGRNDYFPWPLLDDIAQVESTFVYRWDFHVMPNTSDNRIWNVPDIFTIAEAYKKNILTANH